MTATLAKLQGYLDGLVNDQDQRVQNALAQIPDQHRHILAIRGYIRFANRIADRWAMTDAEEAEFRTTPAFQNMMDDIAAIQRQFAANHAGYNVTARTEARSLNTQIRLWNGNDTALALGRRLQELALLELGRRRRYPDPHTAASLARFSRWIGRVGLRVVVVRNTRNGRVRMPFTSPSNATPGLSSHGKIRAMDFVVRRGNAVIAGTNSAQRESVWRGPDNWQQRLNNAITAVSANWEGPLANPDEPWHYTYVPGPS